MYYGEVRIPNNELEPLIRTATSLKIKGLSTQFTGSNSNRDKCYKISLTCYEPMS